MRVLSSARRLALGAGFALALGAGCVRQVNFAQQLFFENRAYNIMYEGPTAPTVTKLADGAEVRFDRHDVRLEKSRVVVDGKEIAIDPGSLAVDLRVTRERFRIIVNGQDVLYQRN